MSAQICILKVHINCKGCEKKINKVLLNTQGVEKVKIDLEEGKVEVKGNVEAKELLTNLKKKGKHAEICSIKNPFKKTENEEEKKSKGSFLGSLFSFGKKSKNGAGTCKNCNCNNNSNSIDDHDNNGNDHDIPIISHPYGEGSNGNEGQMQIQVQPSLYDQQQYMVNNNGSMQENSMMNNEYHHYQGMQMQLLQPFLYDQQQYRAMMNQQQEGNMNMYGGTHTSMNYMANPTYNENGGGYWLM
ncbi:unnamed protein product [Trifolium pratense]|uniref:Uncharacterized protein n=1 Tax=Trifolium pratense TaxID=57577 RepID=A0ACB0IHY2_TRIPR|nr:unnamed protein product [Trifolium pratense]